jgi:hypothetical protein
VRAAAALLALALCSCATVPAKRVETVMITEKQPYPICVGVCIDYSVSISSDGQIDSHAHRMLPGEYRFQVAPQRAADIIASLDKFRPTRPQPILPCEHHLPPSDPFADYPNALSKEPSLVIKWSGSTESQLVGCDFDAATRAAVEQTMKRLDLFIGIPRSVMDQGTK